jgi:DNA-binding NtrC family response regulator
MRGRRVLIVEDEMLIAMELESLLERQGCVVLGPTNTVDRALALLERERPDAVLLDLHLNGQEAIPVAAALRMQVVPFVILTGYGKIRSGAPELQNAPRLNKPVNHEQLVSVLAQALGAS